MHPRSDINTLLQFQQQQQQQQQRQRDHQLVTNDLPSRSQEQLNSINNNNNTISYPSHIQQHLQSIQSQSQSSSSIYSSLGQQSHLLHHRLSPQHSYSHMSQVKSTHESSTSSSFAKRKFDNCDTESGSNKRRRGRRPKDAPLEVPSGSYEFLNLQILCETCHQRYPSQADRICHKPCYFRRKGLHSEPQEWTCEQPECRKCFTNIFHLRQHMAIHYPGNYKCNTCGFTAHRKTVIIKHTRKHLAGHLP